MINEIRTLLHNSSGPADFRWPGEEYLPVHYRPRRLTPALQPIYRVLFGEQPDRFMKNYRLAQLLPLLHASRLSSWLTAGDPRVTYAEDAPAQSSFRFTPWVTEQPDSWFVLSEQSTEASLLLQQQPIPYWPDEDGLCWFEWLIEQSPANTVTLRGLSGSTVDQYHPLWAQADGWSQTLELVPGGKVRFWLGQSGRWLVRLVRRPRRGAGELLNLLQERCMEELNLLWDEQEPFRSCREAFEHSADFAERLAAILIAVAYRVKSLPAEGSYAESSDSE